MPWQWGGRRAGAGAGPSYAGDFPDPSLLVDGSATYAFATGSAGSNLQRISTGRLTDAGPAAWSAPTDPLPALPRWAAPGYTWSPSVALLGGRAVLWYTVRDRASGRQGLSRATAPSPSGTFTDTSAAAAVCQLDEGGSIDPDVFVDADGRPYLLWKSDANALGRASALYAQRLTADGLGLVGSPVRLLGHDRRWEEPLIEGPAMVHTADGYHLFYGAGWWESATASIGHATCAGPLGACTKPAARAPWLTGHGPATGPAGPAVARADDGTLLFAYHAWTNGIVGYAEGGVRALFVARLELVDGRPALRPLRGGAPTAGSR